VITVVCTNVAGGRLVDANGRYLDADRTADFGRALAGSGADVLIVTELDPDGDQLERLAAEAMPGRDVEFLRHGFSHSHIPGVRRLGVGIASAYPVSELARIDLPDPSFEMLHWRTGDPLEWHPKGFLVARGDFGELGQVDIVGGQVCPIHMGRDADGIEYTYSEGPGREFGLGMIEHLGRELAARGVERAVLAGDLNMPDPRGYFGRLGLVDGFGDPAPATTPDGRSIDRVFASKDLVMREVEVVRIQGADHYAVVARVARRTPEIGAIGKIRAQDLARPPRSGGPSRSGFGRPGQAGRGPR
jgi:endonuclease/exonuclease/phosphatase family metal-dependent hydrolase